MERTFCLWTLLSIIMQRTFWKNDRAYLISYRCSGLMGWEFRVEVFRTHGEFWGLPQIKDHPQDVKPIIMSLQIVYMWQNRKTGIDYLNLLHQLWLWHRSSFRFLILVNRKCTLSSLRCKRGMGFPARWASGAPAFFHHPINLFQCEALGLPYKEIGVDKAENTSWTPKEKDFWTEVLRKCQLQVKSLAENTHRLVSSHKIRGNYGDDTVP